MLFPKNKKRFYVLNFFTNYFPYTITNFNSQIRSIDQNIKI